MLIVISGILACNPFGSSNNKTNLPAENSEMVVDTLQTDIVSSSSLSTSYSTNTGRAVVDSVSLSSSIKTQTSSSVKSALSSRSAPIKKEHSNSTVSSTGIERVGNNNGTSSQQNKAEIKVLKYLDDMLEVIPGTILIDSLSVEDLIEYNDTMKTITVGVGVYNDSLFSKGKVLILPPTNAVPYGKLLKILDAVRTDTVLSVTVEDALLDLTFTNITIDTILPLSFLDIDTVKLLTEQNEWAVDVEYLQLFGGLVNSIDIEIDDTFIKGTSEQRVRGIIRNSVTCDFKLTINRDRFEYKTHTLFSFDNSIDLTFEGVSGTLIDEEFALRKFIFKPISINLSKNSEYSIPISIVPILTYHIGFSGEYKSTFILRSLGDYTAQGEVSHSITTPSTLFSAGKPNVSVHIDSVPASISFQSYVKPVFDLYINGIKSMSSEVSLYYLDLKSELTSNIAESFPRDTIVLVDPFSHGMTDVPWWNFNVGYEMKIFYSQYINFNIDPKSFRDSLYYDKWLIDSAKLLKCSGTRISSYLAQVHCALSEKNSSLFIYSSTSSGFSIDTALTFETNFYSMPFPVYVEESTDTLYVRVKAINQNGIETVSPYLSIPPNNGNSFNTFTDGRDGKVYKYVSIGNQVWMAENLRFEAGDIRGNSFIRDLDIKALGMIYRWDVAMNGGQSSDLNPSGVTGICPSGWHLPSDSEWDQLANYVAVEHDLLDGKDNDWQGVGAKLKAQYGWCLVASSSNYYSCIGTDDYGFTGLEGYDIDWTGRVDMDNAYWWSTTTTQSGSGAYYRSLNRGTTFPGKYTPSGALYAIRCVKD